MFVVFLYYLVINYRPILALTIILIGFLVSISLAFLDMLGPRIPLPRKSISEILKTFDNSSLLLAKKHKDVRSTKQLAELYLNQEILVHGYSNLNFNKNLSDPENGKFTFFSAVCYGSSENDCVYLNSFLKSSDDGNTWKIGFLE